MLSYLDDFTADPNEMDQNSATIRNTKKNITLETLKGMRKSLDMFKPIKTITADCDLNGTFDGDSFLEFINSELHTHFESAPNDILIMDHCKFHHRRDVITSLHEKNIAYKFTPPYSPQLNPIEEYFSFFKSKLAPFVNIDTTGVFKTKYLYCCPVCNYPINAPINSANTLPVGVSVQCDLSMRHIQCSCCMRWIVERPELKIRCMSCGLVSCHLVYNECINCNGGCLHLFRDYLKDPNLNLCHNSVPTFIRDNYFESSILRDYLNAQGKSPKEMYNEALQQLDNGEIDLRYNSTQGSSNQSNATSSSHQLVYCTECNEKQRDLLTFQYYRHIPRSQLPHEVRDRVDCYYGYLCRTQRHLLNHAIQYNHACDPTRPVN